MILYAVLGSHLVHVQYAWFLHVTNLVFITWLYYSPVIGIPDSKVHEAYMRSTWGRQVGPCWSHESCYQGYYIIYIRWYKQCINIINIDNEMCEPMMDFYHWFNTSIWQTLPIYLMNLEPCRARFILGDMEYCSLLGTQITKVLESLPCGKRDPDWHKYYGMCQFLVPEGLRRLDMELEVDARREKHWKQKSHISCMLGRRWYSTPA